MRYLKLNLDYYKKDILYNQLDREDVIYNYIKQYPEQEYEDIFETDNHIETISALSDMRKNIVNWYPFKRNSSILEIGAGVGEITGELCKTAHKVVAVEFSKVRGEAIAKRHQDKENLEVIIGNLKDIEWNEKFDYITLIGILEYAPCILEAENAFLALLKYAKSLLKEDGTILLATNNKFGMRNWSVINEDDKNVEFNAVSCKKSKWENQLFSKRALEKMLNEAELGDRKYYYPLPDYQYVNVIFTNEYMPDKNNLHRNMAFFKDTDIINFHENNGYLQIIEDNQQLYEFFANSFLVEISQHLVENQIKYVSFWNNRKPKYRLKTIMQGDKVYKYAINEFSRQHIQNIKNNIDILRRHHINTLDEYDEEKIISRYATNGKPYEQVVIEEYENKGMERLIELIHEFSEKLIQKLELTDSDNNVLDYYRIAYTKEEIEGLHFVKYGLIDLNFQNCFVINKELYIYDQEWIEDKAPIEFIIYRQMLMFEQLRKKVNIDALYERLGLLKYQTLFDKLEQAISNKIMSDKICTVWNRPMKNVRGLVVENCDLKAKNTTLDKQLQQEQEQNEKNRQQLEELLKEKEEREQTIDRLNQSIHDMVNSKSWKITKPLREVTKYLSNGGNK